VGAGVEVIVGVIDATCVGFCVEVEVSAFVLVGEILTEFVSEKSAVFLADTKYSSVAVFRELQLSDLALAS